MHENFPILFMYSLNFILLFPKFAPIIPRIIRHQAEPRQAQNKNFISVHDVFGDTHVGTLHCWTVHVLAQDIIPQRLIIIPTFACFSQSQNPLLF